MRTSIAAALILMFSPTFAQDRPNGLVQTDAAGTKTAWDAQAGEWIDLESFWLRYAERSGGLTWGKTDTYPPYNDVNEYDLLLVDTSEGVCLMEFFHRRWRRANDVRRWDNAFNEYGGCPYVFD